MSVVWLLHFFNESPLVIPRVVAFDSGKLPGSVPSANSIQLSVNCTRQTRRMLKYGNTKIPDKNYFDTLNKHFDANKRLLSPTLRRKHQR